MQTRSQLIAAFDQACAWNAGLYAIHKACSTGLTLFLFTLLQSNYFSVYTNINSIIFLMLLWTDCGFKKSIARFLPEYEHDGVSFSTLIHRLIVVRIILIVCALPICIYVMHKTCMFLQITDYYNLLLLGSMVFCAEGILLFLQLIYHAYFLNKYFNILKTIGLLLYSSSALILCTQGIDQKQLIFLLILIQAIISASIALIAYICLWHMRSETKRGSLLQYSPKINRQFVSHSLYMWASTALKSLTERNALLPLLTYSLGPHLANIFKIANESALFFYRIALKTIGTNDTVMLTHARMYQQNMDSIFGYLKRKIAILCLGVSLLFIPAFISKWYSYTHTQTVYLFFVITICYLLEVFLSPYERILEVDFHYAAIFKAQIPYGILLITLFTTSIICKAGLFLIIALIHAIRILSAVLMMLQAKKRYHRSKPAPFPFKESSSAKTSIGS